MRLLFFILVLTSMARGGEQIFSSGAQRVHLLELYTSEGCSSCPPAEAWLSQLRDSPNLWRNVVPVAWHVDYWDRLGWKDTFASKAATEREYAFARRWQSESVYTPCFALDGTEWQQRSLPSAASESVGELRVVRDDDTLRITFSAMRPGDYEAHAVVLTMGVRVKVRAGENAGRDLRHDFIATGAEHAVRLVNGQALLKIAIPVNREAAEHAVAAWITDAGHLEPVQAVGGLLDHESAR